MKQNISKKRFRINLLKIGRDIRHGLFCDYFLSGTIYECDCYSINILDSDIDDINKNKNKFKNNLEAVKWLVNKELRKIKRKSTKKI